MTRGEIAKAMPTSIALSFASGTRSKAWPRLAIELALAGAGGEVLGALTERRRTTISRTRSRLKSSAFLDPATLADHPQSKSAGSAHLAEK